MIFPKSCEGEKAGHSCLHGGPCCRHGSTWEVAESEPTSRLIRSVLCPCHCRTAHGVAVFVTAVSQWCVAVPFPTVCVVSRSPRYCVSAKREVGFWDMGYLAVIILGILFFLSFSHPYEGRVLKLLGASEHFVFSWPTGIVTVWELDTMSVHMHENHTLPLLCLCCCLRADPVS